MNNPRSCSQFARVAVAVVLIASALCAAGCGVRGRPQPPLTPPELGRGEPTFKRATEEFAFPNVPSPDVSPTPRTQSRPTDSQ